MRNLSVIKLAAITFIIVFCFTTAAVVSSAQTFSNLASFTTGDGISPTGPLTQGLDGNFYGIATGGGANIVNCENMDTVLCGTVFKVTSSGQVSPIYSFCTNDNCADGQDPNWGLALATNGDLYGTTFEGGVNPSRSGTAFEVTAAGKLTTLHSFCNPTNCSDGKAPEGGLLLGSNGNFYGTTVGGGGSQGLGEGTILEITPAGNLTTLHDFCPQGRPCNAAQAPNGGLVQAANGNFYGTTTQGGNNNSNCGIGCGVIFEITQAGKFTTLHSFCSQASCPDGAAPQALVLASNGNLYGTTGFNGAHGAGTFFKITPAGKFSTIYSFTAGETPDSVLIQATDGNFYGTTYGGGANKKGSVVEITAAGKVTKLHSFCSQKNCLDGAYPQAVIEGTDGTLYGTTLAGGNNNFGIAYSLGVGLAPFVKTVPSSGADGAQVVILGNDLTGTTNVSFNGKAATFKVVSDTEISATVPNGATAGTVKVTTSSATLDSNVAFQVMH